MQTHGNYAVNVNVNVEVRCVCDFLHILFLMETDLHVENGHVHLIR